ncbi:MATE family multidrug resistance protein [Bradyrhizobium sp. USDA 3686]|uniref:MATE family efflux transporter n=1 Tax=Bradyrhizobium canariense TaxID=255045 RepID=UPI0028987C38|nr:MATE family efflux transporter [Bradyrhizobium canariense]MBM7487856.1 MATE family multidrug resistance protein [Bradyrhizobium canariense]
MMLTQLGQLAMMTTDLALVGRIGVDELAAAALAGRIYLVSFTFAAGLLAPIAPLAAQAFAAHNLAMVRRLLRTGLWAALLASVPIMAFALQGEQMLLALGQAPDAARLAQQYLFGLAWGIAPALCFQAIRGWMGGVNRTSPVLWITVGAVPVNAILINLLIYGNFGLPRLGLFGVGLVTTLVNFGMFSAGLWILIRHRHFRAYYLLAHIWRFDWSLVRHLSLVGTPISLVSLIAYGAISAAAILAGQIGTSELAAHQIALQVATTSFLIALGVSMASSVRVGQAVGRNDSSGVKRAGLIAMLLGIVIVTILTLAVIVARFEVPKLFLAESSGGADATIAIAARLLPVSASFLITDAVASIAAGGLRGLKDTRVPLLFAGITYWPIGVSLSYVLSLKIGLSVIGIWIGLSIGTSVYAGLLVLRFHVLSRRLALKGRLSP